MTHGRHDRGDERRAGSSRPARPTDLYERPRTEFVANFLGVSNLIDAQRDGHRRRRSRTSRPTTAPRCTCPRERVGRATPTTVRVGVRPEKIDARPGRRHARRTARNVLRGTVVVAVVPRRLDPVRRPGRRRRGADRVRPERARARSRSRSASGREVQLAWDPQPHVRRRPGGAAVIDPERFERALEEFFDGRALSRRRFIGRAGATGLALAGLAAALPALRRSRARSEQRRQAPAGRRGRQPPEGRRSATGRSPTGRSTSTRRSSRPSTSSTAATSSTSRTSTTTSSSSGRSASSCRPASRSAATSSTLTDYMAAPLGARRLRRADRQEEHPERRQEPRRQPADDQLRPEARRTRCRGSRARSGIGYNIKKTGRELKIVKDLFDPKFKGRVTMLSEPYDSACTVLLGDGHRRLARRRSTRSSRRSTRSTRPTTPASSAASPATTTRPTSPRATSGSRSPTRATSSSCRADNPDLRVRLPRGGRDALHRQHDDARPRPSTRTRPRR